MGYFLNLDKELNIVGTGAYSFLDFLNLISIINLLLYILYVYKRIKISSEEIIHTMQLPKITTKQKEILFLLYRFRFLNTHQFQGILGHKNPKRIQAWLKDLKEKEYTKTVYTSKSYIENTKPAVHYLAPKSIHILKEDKRCVPSILNRIYKEKTRKKKFIDHCLVIADVYIFFLSRKTVRDELYFFTESDLLRYDYFPDPLPSVYISIKTEKGISRYFLDLFDDFTPPFVFRNRFKTYLEYFENEKWQENTNNAPFPTILFVCPNNRLKNHTYYYTKAVIDKSFIEEVTLFLATKDSLKATSENSDIWLKVE